jgi:hypothetical protein
MRFTHDGMPVKFTLVLEAVTAVPVCKLSYTAPLFVVTPALPLIVTVIMLLLQVQVLLQVQALVQALVQAQALLQAQA